MKSDDTVLGVVGPCAAGKSTLVEQLRTRGFQVKHIAQEHSYVKDMWALIAKPDFLIFLDVSYEISSNRNQSPWPRILYDNQVERLEHARMNADLYIDTNDKTPAEVLELVLGSLGSHR
jgi:thymidylate kinase